MTSQAPAKPAPPISLLRGASLFLDFDGTLVPIAARPDQVVVDARLRALIGRLLVALEGRVAILSGRSISNIGALLGGSLLIGGSHGLELRWPDGRARSPEPPAALAQLAEAMEALRSRYPDLLVEEKPFGVALHYRQVPEAEPACRSLAVALAEAPGLTLQPGKMMVEVRVAAGDKGDALAAFMDEPPMAGARPVFLGDDLTDEPGFARAAALGGVGVMIGAREETAARYRLADVGAALDWLTLAAEAAQ